MTTRSMGSSGSFSSQRSSAKAAAMANLAAKRKQRNASRFENRHKQSHNGKIETRQEDPVGVDASTVYKLEEQRVKTEKEMVGAGNEALILVYGYNPNLYEDVFDLSPYASIQDIKRSYEDQKRQLEFSMATVFTTDVPSDEINGGLNSSQLQAATLCGMTSAHMEQMHPRNFMEFKLDALERAFDILKDERSRLEYNAVLTEFQESVKGIPVVDGGDNYYKVHHDMEYGENGDYSYDENEDGDGDVSRTSFDSCAAWTAPNGEGSSDVSRTSFDGRAAWTAPHGEPYDEPQSPPQTFTKHHPWKQELQRLQESPKDPFEFDDLQFPVGSDVFDDVSLQQQKRHDDIYSVSSHTTHTTRSFHVELFDPFDLQGADQINFEHLPMVEEETSPNVEEKEVRKDDETITVLICPLPTEDDKDNDDDGDDAVTVGEVIEARERGEDIDVRSMYSHRTQEYTDMVDCVPKKKNGIKPKLQSMYQSMKRSIGGASKSSKSIASDSTGFQSQGVSAMSISKKNNIDPQQARKEVTKAIDPQGHTLSREKDDDDISHTHQVGSDDDDDDDDDDDISADLISDLTQNTFPYNRNPPQPVDKNQDDLEIESFINMANNFRAMDEAEKKSPFNKTKRMKKRMSRKTPEPDSLSSNQKRAHLTQMKSLLSDEESVHGDDMTFFESLLDEFVAVIDEIEEMYDDSLKSISSFLTCE